MKVIILCGGKGLRFPGAYPKPMNRVWGKMIGEWVSQSLREHFSEVFWVLNPVLEQFSIREEILRWWKGGTHYIYTLPFETRDPCETLVLGLQHFLKENVIADTEDILILDNDNYYDETLLEFQKLQHTQFEAGVLVGSIPTTNSNRYGFVHYDKRTVSMAKEKITGWGENGISYGAYWFRSIQKYITEFFKHRRSINIQGEISLLNLLYSTHSPIAAIYTENTYSLGTPDDCKYTYQRNPQKFGWKCKVVVDLDNTLVSYPTQCKNYSTCKEKTEVTEWVRNITEEGAHVIVATARQMETYKGSVGSMIKHSGLQTLTQIKDLDLGESEIIFGKPLGDIYIDDRAINPYSPDWKIMAGTTSSLIYDKPSNFMGCTRNVSISLEPTKWVIKKGPIEELDGQYFFYSYLEKSDNEELKSFFPKCYDKLKTSNTISLYLENLSGVPGGLLVSYSILGTREWEHIIRAASLLHSVKYSADQAFLEDIRYQWLGKIEDRIQKYSIYKQVDVNLKVWSYLHQYLKSYIETEIDDVSLIHGDFWLSNIIFTSKDIKLIDMRGKIKDNCTIYGDPMYDWAKLGTSLLGMDAVVYNLPKVNSYYLFEKLVQVLPLNKQRYLLPLSLSLMYSALWVYDLDKSKKIMTLINDIIHSRME